MIVYKCKTHTNETGAAPCVRTRLYQTMKSEMSCKNKNSLLLCAKKKKKRLISNV